MRNEKKTSHCPDSFKFVDNLTPEMRAVRQQSLACAFQAMSEKLNETLDDMIDETLKLFRDELMYDASNMFDDGMLCSHTENFIRKNVKASILMDAAIQQIISSSKGDLSQALEAGISFNKYVMMQIVEEMKHRDGVTVVNVASLNEVIDRLFNDFDKRGKRPAPDGSAKKH
jgi:hypothetical protein